MLRILVKNKKNKKSFFSVRFGLIIHEESLLVGVEAEENFINLGYLVLMHSTNVLLLCLADFVWYSYIFPSKGSTRCMVQAGFSTIALRISFNRMNVRFPVPKLKIGEFPQEIGNDLVTNVAIFQSLLGLRNDDLSEGFIHISYTLKEKWHVKPW